MRDGSIFQMHQANARRNALLLGQFEFLQTRQEALERVIRKASWWDRLNWIISVEGLFRVVDALQINLLNERRQQLEKVAAKPHIEVIKANA